MNHLPFEDWLHNPGSLDGRQKRELQAHLKECPDCTALAEVELALKNAPVLAPQAGFTGRFQMRLAQAQLAQRRRNIWGFVLLALAVLAGLLWLAWPLIGTLVRSPATLLSSWLAGLLALWTSLQAMGHVSELLFQTLPGFVPPAVWAVLLFCACAWGALWILSLMKFTKVPQGVQQ